MSAGCLRPLPPPMYMGCLHTEQRSCFSSTRSPETDILSPDDVTVPWPARDSLRHASVPDVGLRVEPDHPERLPNARVTFLQCRPNRTDPRRLRPLHPSGRGAWPTRHSVRPDCRRCQGAISTRYAFEITILLGGALSPPGEPKTQPFGWARDPCIPAGNGQPQRQPNPDQDGMIGG
jgi:hypothetical protein